MGAMGIYCLFFYVGCETWSLNVRNEHTLRASANALDEMIDLRKKNINAGMNDRRRSFMRSRMMKWVGICSAPGKYNAYKILIET